MIWLVDEAGGYATVKEMAQKIVGNLRGGPTNSIIGVLVSNGWCEIYGAPEGKQMLGSIKVTMVGLIFRDYLQHRPRYREVSTPEMHARIRALELALQPLADAWARIESGDHQFLHMQLDSCGISPLQAQLAHKILNYDDAGVVYPWTPGKIRLSGT